MKKEKNKFTFCKVNHDSPEYWAIVELRDRVLRKPLGLEFMREELMDENEQFHFGYFLHNDLVGCLVFKNIGNSELKMRQVAINPYFQKHGIGSKMVIESENWAIKNGFTKISLHARELAKSFYIKMNYQVIGSSFLEVGISHFKLFKLLS